MNCVFLVNDLFLRARIVLSRKYRERNLRRFKFARDMGKAHGLAMTGKGRVKAVVPGASLKKENCKKKKNPDLAKVLFFK